MYHPGNEKEKKNRDGLKGKERRICAKERKTKKERERERGAEVSGRKREGEIYAEGEKKEREG
jgi:hypothetical protein